MTRFVAQCLSGYVPNLRQIVHEQVDRLGQEVRKEIVRVAKHTTAIRNDSMRDELEQRSRIMMVASARRSEGGEEESQVLPLRLPILIRNLVWPHCVRLPTLTSEESDLSPTGAVPFSNPSAVCSKVIRMVISVKAHQRK